MSLPALLCRYPQVDPAEVSAVERDLLALLSGFAPAGMQVTDVEEEYVVDEASGVGSWRPVAAKQGKGAAREGGAA